MLARVSSLVLLIILVFTSGSSIAAERVALPGDMIVDISTGKLDNSIQSLEAFLIKAIEGTPVAPYLRPGQIGMSMTMLIRMHPSAMDMTKPMRLVVCNPGNGGEPPSGLILPLKDNLKAALAIGEQFGITAVEADGGYKVTVPFTPSPMYMIDIGDKRAVASAKEKFARHLAGIVKGWNPPLSEKPTLTATVEVAKAVKLNAGNIDASLAGIEAMLKNAAGQPDALPDPQMMWMKVGLPYLKKLRLLGEGVELITKELYASAESLRVRTSILPVAGTSLEKITKDFAGTTPAYEMLNLYPPESPMVCAVNTSKYGNPDLMDILIQLVKEMEKSLLPDATSELTTCIRKSMELMGDDITVGILPADKTGSARYGSYLRVKDGKTYVEQVGKATTASLKLVDVIYKTMGTGIKLNATVKRNAGAIDGIQYDQISWSIAAADGGGKMPPEALQMMKEMAKIQTQTIASIDNTVFVAQGSNCVDTLKAMIKAVSEYNPKAAPARKIPADSQIFFSQISLLDMIKVIVTQQLKMVPMPGMKDAVDGIVAAIPGSSTDPVIFRGGSKEDAIVLAADIPAPAVSELITNMHSAFVKVRKVQMENMRRRMKEEEEPPVPEEEAPVEAF